MSSEKVEVIDARPRMNLLIYDNFPRKLLNSLCEVNGFMVAMANAFFRSISIPRLCTKKPKNFPVDTPNAHLRGFILSL